MKTILKYVVNENIENLNTLNVSVYRDNNFDYKINIIKNENNKSLKSGETYKNIIIDENYRVVEITSETENLIPGDYDFNLFVKKAVLMLNLSEAIVINKYKNYTYKNWLMLFS